MKNRKAILCVIICILMTFSTGCVSMDKVISKTVKKMEAEQKDRTADLMDIDSIKVVLAGTGNPMSQVRAQSATAVFVNGQFLLFDCGDGSQRAMESQNLPMELLDAVFLTHYHSDHIADLGEVISRSFVMGRQTELDVYGGAGVETIVEGFNNAYSNEYSSRINHHGEEMLPSEYAGANAVVFDGDALDMIVYEKDGVVVRSFKTAHPPVTPNVGYSIEFKGKKIVIAGDTIVTDNLKAHVKDADVLVGDALNRDFINKLGDAFGEIGNDFRSTMVSDVSGYILDVNELAELSQEAGVKTLALTHLSPPPEGKAQMKMNFLNSIKKVYKGEIVAGDDGTTITVPLD